MPPPRPFAIPNTPSSLRHSSLFQYSSHCPTADVDDAGRLSHRIYPSTALTICVPTSSNHPQPLLCHPLYSTTQQELQHLRKGIQGDWVM